MLMIQKQKSECALRKHLQGFYTRQDWAIRTLFFSPSLILDSSSLKNLADISILSILVLEGALREKIRFLRICSEFVGEDIETLYISKNVSKTKWY